jgi:DNA-binding GntR family transcriptional regulator
MAENKVSVAQAAYESIRRRILLFKILPGQHINEVVLAEELKISRTPLREALNRLVAEGLFVARERGFSVPDLNPSTIQQLFEARIEVESSLVRFACERASSADIDALAEFVDESAAESPDVSVDKLVELDCRFHETIGKLSGNNELLRILKNLNDRIHLIRWIKMEGKRVVTQGEHRQILECLRNRDAAGAERLMRMHILHRNDEILAAIRSAYAHVHTAHFADMTVPGQSSGIIEKA